MLEVLTTKDHLAYPKRAAAVLASIVGFASGILAINGSDQAAQITLYVAFAFVLALAWIGEVSFARLADHVASLRRHILDDAEARRLTPPPPIPLAELERLTTEVAQAVARRSADVAVVEKLQAIRDLAQSDRDALHRQRTDAVRSVLRQAAASGHFLAQSFGGGTSVETGWSTETLKIVRLLAPRLAEGLDKCVNQTGPWSDPKTRFLARAKAVSEFVGQIDPIWVLDSFSPQDVVWTDPLKR